MNSTDLVTVQLPRSALVVQAPEPVSVSQRTVQEVFGLTPRAYLGLCKRDAFPVTRVGRLRVAMCSDLRAYLTAERERAQPRAAGGAMRYILAAGGRRL